MSETSKEIRELLRSFFEKRKKEKAIMNLSVISINGQTGFKVGISDEVKTLISDDAMGKIEDALKNLCDELSDVFSSDEESFVKFMNASEDHDCENCDKREECEEMNRQMRNGEELN